MSDCIWVADAINAGQWICAQCSRHYSTRISRESAPIARRNCIKPRTQRCQHLGPATGFVECPTCQGNVRLKVFACEIHKAATIKKPMNGLACCSTCKDYLQVRDTADEAGSAAG